MLGYLLRCREEKGSATFILLLTDVLVLVPSQTKITKLDMDVILGEFFVNQNPSDNTVH